MGQGYRGDGAVGKRFVGKGRKKDARVNTLALPLLSARRPAATLRARPPLPQAGGENPAMNIVSHGARAPKRYQCISPQLEKPNLIG